MADSPLKRLIVQASHYGLGSLLTMLAGLVTFPLLTRTFSVSDYGAMSLIAATLTVSVAVGKVGVQHSILRYHSEIVAGKSPYTLPQFYSTILFGMLTSGALIVALVVVGTRLAPAGWLGDPKLPLLFAIAGFIILAQVLESALLNFLRAEQKSATILKYQVAKKYLGLALIVAAIVLVSRTLSAFYTAALLTETLAVLALAYLLFRRAKRPLPTTANFSRPLYRELLSFGIPMMIGYELSGLILAVGDRYVINGMIGSESLGLYSAAYNLCQYVQAVVVTSVGQAVMPIYMEIWAQKGPEETASFLNRSLRSYVLLGVPVVAGIAAVGPELLPSLASEKYADAGVILPWVMAGMILDGTTSMLGAGLFIQRRTRTIMAIVLSCAALNLGLNVILLPRIGILGSAIATMISYAATSVVLAIAGHRHLATRIPWGTLARASAASAIMYAAVSRVLPGHRLLTVGVRAAVGVVVYGLIMLAIDTQVRELSEATLGRFRRSEVG